MGVTRREALAASAAVVSAFAAGPEAASADKTAAESQTTGPAVKRGRLKQSVSRWCYGKISMPEFCDAVKAMELTAIARLNEPDWQVAADHEPHHVMAYGRRLDS
jgi:hydroxypyruvate isomerase